MRRREVILAGGRLKMAAEPLKMGWAAVILGDRGAKLGEGAPILGTGAAILDLEPPKLVARLPRPTIFVIYNFSLLPALVARFRTARF